MVRARDINERLKQSGVGCHIGLNYDIPFGYVDDVASLGPRLSGLKRIVITLCCNNRFHHRTCKYKNCI